MNIKINQSLRIFSENVDVRQGIALHSRKLITKRFDRAKKKYQQNVFRDNLECKPIRAAARE